MDIEIQSQDLIDAISERLAKTVIELETTKIALRQTQEVANSATRALNEMLFEHQNPGLQEMLSENQNLGELTNKAFQLHETKEHPSAE